MKDRYYIRVYLYCKIDNALLLVFLCFTLLWASLVQAAPISIATQNTYNFYNAKDDGKKEKVLSKTNYQLRLKRMSKHIAYTLDKPDIIALQEVENFATLSDLKNVLEKDFGLCYQAVLLNGHKRVSINVAYLVNCEFSIDNLSQLFKSHSLKNIKKKLFTRPPLYINLCKKDQCLHIVNVHLSSMIGLNNVKKRRYVATKRLQQAETLAIWINQFQKKWPEEKLIVLGDFNALNVSDQYVDVLGIIKGSPALFNELYPSSDLIKRNLFDLSLQIPINERYSYRYKKKQQILDYVLVSQNLISSTKSIQYTNINYKVSDHAGLVTLFDY